MTEYSTTRRLGEISRHGTWSLDRVRALVKTTLFRSVWSTDDLWRCVYIPCLANAFCICGFLSLRFATSRMENFDRFSKIDQQRNFGTRCLKIRSLDLGKWIFLCDLFPLKSFERFQKLINDIVTFLRRLFYV